MASLFNGIYFSAVIQGTFLHLHDATLRQDTSRGDESQKVLDGSTSN